MSDFILKNRRAFTLIELLVVVLIIGVLAAIALPRYKIAVEKANAQKLIVIVRSLVSAQTRYFLATGRYTDRFDLLDLDFLVTQDDFNYIKFDGNSYLLYVHPSGQSMYVRGHRGYGSTNGSPFKVEFNIANGKTLAEKDELCFGQVEIAEKMCPIMGYTVNSSSYLWVKP